MKKYLKWDVVLGIVLFIGMTVVSGAFVHYSYANVDEYPAWLSVSMRIVGFVGLIVFPTRLATGLQEYDWTYDEYEETESV